MAKTKKAKTVKVQIRASHKVHYLQTVEMKKEDWDRFQKAVHSQEYDEADEIAKELAEVYIDVHNEFDFDDFEGEDVEIEEAK